MDDKNALLRALPKVDDCMIALLNDPDLVAPHRVIKTTIQKAIDEEREKILAGQQSAGPLSWADWLVLFKKTIAQKLSPNLKRVINGTGVVIHTNLGRSLLPVSTTRQLVQAGEYYSNLEFDLSTGKRGSRYSLVEELICYLTGAEAALVVNNNAAAVLVSLDTLAKNKEVIVSRGQLVEIGGSFRIPDVMEKSGAKLVEVGATNRTHTYDYEKAITPETALLLKVHTSNFRIIGFSSAVSAEELVAIGRNNRLVTMEDLGSGSMIDLSEFGFPKEPTVQEIVNAGVDVVTFSGDKLLGGPQAGIIVGTKEVIQRIKKNPLNRALRIDKFTLSSLECILREYLDCAQALKNIPTLAMLTISGEDLKKRAQRILRLVKRKIDDKCQAKIVSTLSRVGGGALPEISIKSWAIDLAPKYMKVNVLERRLRGLSIPIIGRIENDHFLLDVRTIQDREVQELAVLLASMFEGGEQGD